MKSISRWAHKHPWYARIIIVLCHCILICIALIIGILLQDGGIQFAPIVLTSLSITFLVLLLKYPSKQKLPFAMSYTYARRKWADLGIIVNGFCLIMSMTNLDIVPEPHAMPVQMVIVPLVHQIPPHKELRHEQKELRQEVKKQIRERVKKIRKELSGWAAVLIGVGFVLAFILSVALILVLSSSIASGAVVMAVAVFLGGLWLSIFLLVIGFKWLIRKRKLVRGEVLPETQ